MKRILIWELKNPIGGVENVIMNYLHHFDKGEIVPDIMFKGDFFPYEKEIEEMGGSVFYMPSYLPNIWKYRKMVKLIFADITYDAVWCNFSGLTNIEVLKMAKEYNVPIRISHSHVTKLIWGSKIARLIVVALHFLNKKKIANYVTDYWCCSEDAGKFMFPNEVWNKLTVVKDAIDLDKYLFTEEKRSVIRKGYGINNELVIGHIGRFTVAKNQKYLIDIFKEVLKKEPTAKLLFVAEGELENVIKSYAKQIGVYNSVIFTDHVDDVSKYYSAMDVFLLPSNFEGLGMVLIEAQAAGTPCIASTNVPRDAKVTDGIEFLSIDEDPQKWAEKAIEMSKNRIENPVDSIKSFGFDIKEEAKRVEAMFER